jgi:uncharacterized protein YndB with AHSA1/START domain
MITVEKRVVIDRAAEDVFAYVLDPTNSPRWQRGLTEVRRITPDPVGVGTRHVVARTFMSRRVELENEFTRYEPDRLVEFRMWGTMQGRASYVVDRQSAESTTLISRIELHPSGVARLAEPLMAAALRRDVEANLARLKQQLEAEPR